MITNGRTQSGHFLVKPSSSELTRLIVVLPVPFEPNRKLNRDSAFITSGMGPKVRRRVIMHADEAKGRRNLNVPLTEAAVALIRAQIGRHLRYVITYQGKRVYQVNGKAWKAVLERAGIKVFRWHDLRHTWATWHVLHGTSLHELKELGGWQSLEMVLRYAHLVDNAQFFPVCLDAPAYYGFARRRLRATRDQAQQ